MSAAAAVQAQAVIFVVDDDWRTRDFICTVLKYSTNARVMEASRPQEALLQARDVPRVDLLIANIGIGLAREIADRHASAKVLLMSGRRARPSDLPDTWRFLSIPFQTSAFLQCVSELGKLR